MKRLKQIGDSEYGRMRDMLDLPTTAEQDAACVKLERLGKRFCVDFGYENAEAVLESVYATKLEQLVDAGIM